MLGRRLPPHQAVRASPGAGGCERWAPEPLSPPPASRCSPRPFDLDGREAEFRHHLNRRPGEEQPAAVHSSRQASAQCSISSMEVSNRGTIKDAVAATMPKLLRANAPRDSSEEGQVRRLARSRHAPGDRIRRTRMAVRSWEGLRTIEIAREPGGHPPTVRERGPRATPRFNAAGTEGRGSVPAHRQRLEPHEAAGTRMAGGASAGAPGLPPHRRLPGRTSRQAGGVSSAVRRSPAGPSPMARRSTRLPRWPPGSSTIVPSPGSGAAHPVPTATCAAVLSTRFEEPSTQRDLLSLSFGASKLEAVVYTCTYSGYPPCSHRRMGERPWR